MTTQKERILSNDKIPEHVIAGTVYKGREPQFQPIAGANGVVEWVKVVAGVPFVKVPA